MELNNRGYEIEDRMRRFFKGKCVGYDAVDFETSTTFYEVKSCNIFNPCSNGNHLRKFKKSPHKRIFTFQHGRFQVNTDNHSYLKALAEEHNKKCKYIFVITVGKQIIWKVLDWIDVKIDLEKERDYISISKIFGGD